MPPGMAGAGAVGALLLLMAAAPPGDSMLACHLSEFPCKNNKCIRLDRYCNGRDDCGDKTDEPAHCTVCNRTYYGDVGKTYELSLLKPPADRIPFNCHITFIAGGNGHGDLIQVIFDRFHVGRYKKDAPDSGCPDGHMTITEMNRPFTGGYWCGASSGYAVYFSEESTVTLSLRLLASAALPAAPFHFQLRYRFITKRDAVVRLGGHNSLVERGTGVPGTYCSRNFDECSRKRCKLQSPNYPGMYPRNLSCDLTIRQRDVPSCKHAMISVHQDSEHKVQMKRAATAPAGPGPGPGPKPARVLRVGHDCSDDRDHVVFYDGTTRASPVLIKWCGGDWLPRITSRGPDMLVVFHTSSTSVPLQPPLHALSPLRGFELEVDVLFTDSDSFDYQREPRSCVFWIDALGRDSSRWGHILSPRHTLPPNTTCTYHFTGLERDTVWVYFTAYSHRSVLTEDKGLPGVLVTSPSNSSRANKPPSPSPPPPPRQHLLVLSSRPPPAPSLNQWGLSLSQPDAHAGRELERPCATTLRMWSGHGAAPPGPKSSLLLSACDSDGPKLCAHAGNSSRKSRSCGPHESYESIGANLTLQLVSTKGTALNPLHFRLRYEFVNTNLGGEEWTGRSAILAAGAVASTGKPLSRPHIPCARVFRGIDTGELRSPRNVFMFGRGGAANLSCIYRIEAPAGKRIRLSVHNYTFGTSDLVSGSASRAGLGLGLGAGTVAGAGIRGVGTLGSGAHRAGCHVTADPHTERPRCSYSVGARTAELQIWEVVYKDVRLPRACLCGARPRNSSLPFVITSGMRVLEISFTITQLNVTEDFNNFFFHASFEMMKSPECPRSQWMRGAGGEIEFESPAQSRTDSSCEGIPWLIEAHENKSLLLMTWGSFLPVSASPAESLRCHTRSRLLLYSGRPLRLQRVVCPMTKRELRLASHVFSEEWSGLPAGQQLPAPAPGTSSYSAVLQAAPAHGELGEPGAPSFLVEWVGREAGSAALHWLEITRPKLALQQRLWAEEGVRPPPELVPKGNISLDCPYKCPELNACISASLWCDGRPNCPSGFDEKDPVCDTVTRRFLSFLPGGLYFAMTSAGAGVTVVILVALVLILVRTSRRRREQKRHQLQARDGVSTVGTLSSVASASSRGSSRTLASQAGAGGSLPSTYRRGNKSRRRSEGAGLSAGTGRRLSGAESDAFAYAYATQPRRVPTTTTTTEQLLDPS